jgi:hypothetical protein
MLLNENARPIQVELAIGIERSRGFEPRKLAVDLAGVESWRVEDALDGVAPCALVPEQDPEPSDDRDGERKEQAPDDHPDMMPGPPPGG